MGYHFHLILVTEIDFALRISNFHIFLELFWIFSGNMDILWNLLLWSNSVIPIPYKSQTSIMHPDFQTFSGIFPDIIWKSENSFKFQYMGNHSNSIFIAEFIFVLRKITCFYLFEIQDSKNSEKIPNHSIKLPMGLK